MDGLEMVQCGDAVIRKIEERPPIMGLAISGGGYRSMLTSSGFIKEMKKYGLFDCLSYISGLSGGSWVLMDLVIHDFDVDQILDSWDLNDPLLQGIPDLDFKQKDLISEMDEQSLDELRRLSARDFTEIDALMQRNLDFFMNTRNHDKTDITGVCKRDYNPFTRLRELLFPTDIDSVPNAKEELPPSSLTNLQRILNFYISLHLDVRPKRFRGFRVSFTDYLGKAFIKRLKQNGMLQINTTSFSELMKHSPNFLNYRAPVPIFVANCKNKSLKNIIFEFTPFEFGSWESIVRLFVKMPFLGSKFEKGVASKCFNGFDDIGFIAATSSSIFNNVLIYIWELTAKSSKETIKAIRSILSVFGLKNIRIKTDEQLRSSVLEQLKTDYAVVHPNPFFKFPGKKNAVTVDDFLYLVDGGEDGENIPLRPLTIPERKLDLIFVIDSSSDSHNYATGIKLRNVLHQMQIGRKYLAPEEDISLQNPIALGCYEKDIPIIIYQVNSKHSYSSNTSTFKITYNESEISGMLQNGRDIFSTDNNDYYKNCLGCLVLKRLFDELPNSELPIFCSKCYRDFCR